MQEVDKTNNGVKCGRILKIKTFDYVGDIVLAESTMEVRTERLTAIADMSLTLSDMKINMTKTFSQHVIK